MKTGLKQQSNTILIFTAYYNYSCFCPRQKFNLNFFFKSQLKFCEENDITIFVPYFFNRISNHVFSRISIKKEKKKEIHVSTQNR